MSSEDSSRRPVTFDDRLAIATPEGVEVELTPEQQLELNCLGTSPPAVSTSGVSLRAVTAGGCMVSPHGCTMNFIFRSGTTNYIGTAGHCVAGAGRL